MTRGSNILLRLWGALLIAAALVMGPLPLFTFGLMAFGALFVLWLKGGRRRAGWRGGAVEEAPEGHQRDAAQAHWVNGAILLLCAVWFLLNVAVEIARVAPVGNPDRLMVLLMAVAFVFPPLIMHGGYVESGGGARAVAKGMLGTVYAVAFSCSALLFLTAAGARSASRPAALPDTPRPRRYWPFTLLAAASAFVLIASVLITGDLPGYAERLSVVMRSLPVLMLFMASYYERRFEFFDVFVKKSTLFFVLLLLLYAYFSLIPPLLEGQIAAGMRVWIYSLTMLPLAFAIPWLSGRIEGWLDRVWLGRTHTPVEAVGAFLDGFAAVATEEDLVTHAQARLSEVFQAPVSVHLAGDAPPSGQDVETVETVAIPAYGHPGGEIRLGARAQQTPYFRQDLTLLHALAEAFAYMLANLRLQERRQEQDKREQELILGASRAELKALRAQINPHFLFNALNTIAGLIPGDPERAETTVEQLAEVFRYTLRRSEAEWARVEDEIEFVRAYLEVEQARFGDRLRASIEVDPELKDARIPTMMVQTLVENAVKHGLAAVKGQGWLAVDVARRDGRIEIRVADSGPGLDSPGLDGPGLDGPGPRDDRTRATGAEGKVGGYGLENVRRRLAGYYGDSAAFELTRDEAEGLTVATLRLPLESPPEAGRGN